ncbi:MAG: MATE family efflux transporter [Hadesarchaea archaeon]|nr:MATE family efflux transporter [Hadesarchaea archaeon]
MLKGKEDLDLINGRIGKSLLHLSIPIVILNLMRTVYNLIDAFWVGKLGTDPLAAIGFGFPLVLVFISVGIGISVAGSVLVAQYEGSQNKKMTNYSASQVLSFNLIVSVILTIAGFLLAGFLLELYGASDSVFNLAFDYLRTIILGIPFIFGFGAFIAFMRGYGDTKTPMLLMIFSIVLNLILDPILIFGWGPFPALGIVGAAVATVFSRGVAFAIGIAILLSGAKGIKVTLSKMIPDFNFYERIVRLGGPALLGTTGRIISINVIVAIVGRFAAIFMAGYTVGIRIISAIFLSAIAIGRGVTTISGQNLGASEFDRAESVASTGAKYTFFLYTLLGIIIFLLAEPIMSIFTGDPKAISIGGEFLRYSALSLGFIGITQSLAGGIRGAGKTHIAALILLIPLAFVRVPLAFILSRFLGPTGIWIAFPISNIAGAIIAYTWFTKSNWKQKII